MTPTPTINSTLGAAKQTAIAPVKSGFHFDLGKAIGLALLGLAVYKQTQSVGVESLEDPNNLAQIVSGVSAIFHQQQN